MRRTIRRLIWVVFAISAAATVLWAGKVGYAFTVLFGLFDPVLIAEYRLKTADEAAYVQAIEEEIDQGNYATAESLVALAEKYGHAVPVELVSAAEATPLRRTIATGGKFARGFVTGSQGSGEEIAGTVVSDFLVIGDIRDIAVQGANYARGEDYDRIILGLSAIGLLTSGGALVTMGGSAVIDAGISVIKATYKAGRMSGPMLRQLTRITGRLFDRNALAALDLQKMTSAADLRTGLKSVIRQDEAAKLAAIAADAGVIVGKGGARAGAMAFEIADDTKDLTKLRRVSTAYADKTVAVFKIAGKGLLHLADILWHLVSAAVSMLTSLALLVLRVARLV
ncbi:hypothetical protein [Hoeflea sp. TYP-13]|uniref:hypothetical protein n=1 Tax=Hoeflea sp. TYP-13 TaxID=3230023 RepID=UPI0034C67347